MKAVSIRPAAVAGTFYPADRARLRDLVSGLLRTATPPEAPPPRALIVPHAGYRYSGPVAATAYAHLAATRPSAGPVLLLGPAHYVLFDGLALPGAAGFATPMGVVAASEALLERVGGLPGVREVPEAHRPEHSLEVQLPFLQAVLPDAAVLPLAVGRATPARVAAVIRTGIAETGALIVISTDLSHYHDDVTARRLDETTARAVERLRHEELDTGAACGVTALAGLLLAAADLGLHPTRLDLRNSSDTAGSPQRVVGYGAWSLA